MLGYPPKFQCLSVAGGSSGGGGRWFKSTHSDHYFKYLDPSRPSRKAVVLAHVCRNASRMPRIRSASDRARAENIQFGDVLGVPRGSRSWDSAVTAAAVAQKSARLRYAPPSTQLGRETRQCTNIRSGPVDGGRSLEPIPGRFGAWSLRSTPASGWATCSRCNGTTSRAV